MESKAYVLQNEEANLEELEEKLNSLNNSNNYILKKLDGIKIPLKDFTYNFKKYKQCRKIYIASLLATISCFSVVFFIDVNRRYKYYNATEYEYSLEDGLTEESKKIKLKDYEGNKIYIEDFKTIDGQQEIKTYDVSNIKLDNIEDYMTYDVSNLESKETHYESLQEELDDIRKIIKLDVNDSEIKLHNSNFFSIMVTYWIIDLFSIKTNILENKKNMKTTKRETLNIMHTFLNKPVDEIINEINNNDELRNEFIRLYNENKYLLNDPTLLEERYNELIQSLNILELKEDIKELKINMDKLL